MPKGFGYPGSPDTGSIKRQSKPGHGGHEGNAKEFGMSGGKSVVEGLPVDGSAAKVLKKPSDYAEVGTKAKKFT